jgi:hypothetical protein
VHLNDVGFYLYHIVDGILEKVSGVFSFTIYIIPHNNSRHPPKKFYHLNFVDEL